jgi:hypothetical protein
MRNRAISGIVLLLLLEWQGAAGAQSLAELTAQGRPAGRSVELELPDLSLDEMFAKSDVVVQARVRQTTSGLTPDGNSIYTDLAVEPQSFVKAGDSSSRMPSAGERLAKPGVTPEITVRLAGGELEINGQKAKVIYSDLPASSIQTGSIYIFFLRSWPGHPQKFLTGVTSGIFQVRNGRVTPVAKQTRELHSDLHDMPLQEFLAKLR